jgi:hypothetical protein
MSLLSWGPAMLAEVDQTALDALRQGFRSQPHDSNPVTLLWAAVGLFALVMLLDRVTRLWSGRGQVKRVDYLGLAGRQLGLLGHEMHLLRKLAKRSRLLHPARMLLSPANLAYAAQVAQGSKPDPRILLHLNELSLKLFGTPLPDHADAD